jgi:hypothetical protein
MYWLHFAFVFNQIVGSLLLQLEQKSRFCEDKLSCWSFRAKIHIWPNICSAVGNDSNTVPTHELSDGKIGSTNHETGKRSQ